MNINNYIEHTLLKPDTTTDDIKELCEEASKHNFSAVCVPPFFVKTAAIKLAETSVKVATVIGYPMGYNAIPSKVEETKRAIDDGADEIEMVVNVAAVKDQNWSHVQNDIDSVTTTARLRSKKIRITFETGLLNGEEIKKLCEICIKLNVDYIKNATGVNAGGASVDMMAFLKENANGIKLIAAGGIHNNKVAEELINIGVAKLGTSSGIQIIK